MVVVTRCAVEQGNALIGNVGTCSTARAMAT